MTFMDSFRTKVGWWVKNSTRGLYARVLRTTPAGWAALLADISVLGTAVYFTWCILKLTVPVSSGGNNTLKHRNFTNDRNVIDIWTEITTSNVGFNHFPPISFSGMLSGHVKESAPRAVAYTINNFVKKEGYLEAADGTKEHAGLYYIPYGPVDVTYNSLIEIKDIYTEIYFNPRLLNHTIWPLDMHLGSGQRSCRGGGEEGADGVMRDCDPVGYRDLGSFRFVANASVPITATSTCVVVFTYPTFPSGTDSVSFNGMLHFNASVGLDTELSVFDAQVLHGKEGFRPHVNSSAGWHLQARYSLPRLALRLQDVRLLSVELETGGTSTCESPAVAGLVPSYDLCEVAADTVTDLLGESSSDITSSVEDQIRDLVKEALGNRLSFKLNNERFVFACSRFVFSCPTRSSVPALLLHVSDSVRWVCAVLLLMLAWATARASYLAADAWLPDPSKSTRGVGGGGQGTAAASFSSFSSSSMAERCRWLRVPANPPPEGPPPLARTEEENPVTEIELTGILMDGDEDPPASQAQSSAQSQEHRPRQERSWTRYRSNIQFGGRGLGGSARSRGGGRGDGGSGGGSGGNNSRGGENSAQGGETFSITKKESSAFLLDAEETSAPQPDSGLAKEACNSALTHV